MSIGLPQEIIRTGIFVLLLRTKWAYVSRRVMHEAMSDHLVLALKTLAANTSGTPLNRAEVRAVLGVDIGMGAVLIALIESTLVRSATYFKRYCV